MSENKHKKNTGGTTLQALEQCLQQNHIPERFCEEVARLLRVHPTEVALLKLDGSLLRFICPEPLRAAGSIPVSSASTVAAHTVSNKKTEFFNSFAQVKHASIFETVKLGRGEDNAPLEKPIQRLLSAPIVGSDGAVLGVVQICRKGFDLASCGPEFTQADITTIEAAAAVVAQAQFMRMAAAASAR